MNNRGFIILLFALIVGIQWFIPLQMINEKHSIWSEGREFKFRMSPYDVEDPFRGKYLQLRFIEDHFTADDKSGWKRGDPVYVQLKRNAQDFVRITGLTRNLPSGDVDYVKATVRDAYGKDSLRVYIDYPFDRYYINDRMADSLEKFLIGNLQDSSRINYALVRIKSGEAVLEEVFMDGVSVPGWYEELK